MDRKRKKAIEDWAAACAVEALGASRACRRDPNGGGKQLRDFDLIFEDGQSEPLEVTIHAERLRMRARNRIAGIEHEIQASLLRVWVLRTPHTHPGPGGQPVALDVRGLKRELPGVIAAIERAELTEFEASWLQLGSLHEEARRLRSFGIESGRSYDPIDGEPPRILLFLTHGGVARPELITVAVEQEASDTGNQKKLTASVQAPRRHLFIVLTPAVKDSSYWALHNVLAGRTSLPPTPTLPDAITTVWAADRAGGIYVTPPDGWEVFRPSPSADGLLSHGE